MGKRSENTPKSKIRNALRNLFLRSREHSQVLKRDNYTCQRCGVKQSRAKGKEVYVEVHHKTGVTNWQALFDAVYDHLLSSPDNMETLCRECHEKMD